MTLQSGEAPAVVRERAITTLLAFSAILVVMNTMMFNLALPEVAAEFALAPTTTSWIVTGFSIIFAIASITYSRLSDFVPIRTLLTIALLLLGSGSVIGLLSSSFPLLIAARLIQASGAGAISSLGIVLVARYVPLMRRGSAMAKISSAVTLGFGLGPVAGGAIVQYLGWQMLFGVTALTLLLIPAFLVLIPREKPRKGYFDAWGALLIGVGTTGLLLFMTARNGWALVAGVVALLLFAIRIRKVSNPFVMPSIFKDRLFLSLSLIGIFAYMINFSFLYVAPQALTHLHGLTPGASGLTLFPGSLLSMLAAGRIGFVIDKYGNGSLMRYAPWCLFASVVLLALSVAHSHLAIAVFYMLLSLSFNAISSAVSNELSRRLPANRVGAGMGLFQLTQFFSGAFGIALSSSALEWQHALPLGQAFGNLFWGMPVIALLSIASAWAYARFVRRSAA